MKPGARGPAALATNKKKVNRPKTHHRTLQEKKERIWGKTPQKPYISSSLGDMARVMMRYACMESTYFYNNEPPPVEFYDFWQKFSVEEYNDPSDFVDPKKASVPNIKKNTSSFDFFNKYCATIRSQHEIEDVGPEQKKKRIPAVDTQNISDIWKDVRISMSTESFISSSTKISEPASVVPLETGWDEACSEDYQSSESDYGLDIQDKNRHHHHKLHWTMLDDGHDENKPSSIEFNTPQGLIDKQANAIAQSILALQKRDNRILYELATQPRDLDIIDHFADDLDDSFLADSFSYSDLPDAAFGPDFDFLNEDKIYKKHRKAKREGGKKTADGNKSDDNDSDDDRIGQILKAKSGVQADESRQSSETECADENSDTECALKKRKSKGKELHKTMSQRSEVEGYEACLERRRRRIEDGLRAAVRCRSPMGSYRPKPGEEPLSKALLLNSPGPKYYPQISSVKPNIHTALLAPRWNKNIYDTPGPGPAAYYNVNPKCTCEMLTLHEAPRFKDDETIGPGPNVNLSQYKGTAKDKPKAIIVSRKTRDKFTVGGTFTNCQGLTRFGRENPPKALILSNREPKKKFEPGPGEYDPKDLNDTRIGILMKSRIPPLGEDEESPGFLQLPDLIGDAPAFSFGIKNFMERKDQSPGPIYQINNQRPKPVSLTFRPFPMRGQEEEPSPVEWGTKPGKGKLKTLPRAPCPIIYGNHDPDLGKFKTPGPNQYDLEDCPCVPQASIKGRYPEKVSIQPGPADYTPKPIFKLAPRPVFQNRYKEPRNKDDNAKRPRPGYVNPKPPRIVGGVMTPRWRDRQDEEEVGPELLNIFGMTKYGNKTAIPISLKSRHTPFKYSHMADPHQQTHRGEDGKC